MLNLSLVEHAERAESLADQCTRDIDELSNGDQVTAIWLQTAVSLIMLRLDLAKVHAMLAGLTVAAPPAPTNTRTTGRY